MSRFELSVKQKRAWQLLDHPDIAEVFAGGGAGGGKSYLGCLRQIYRRTTYADTRGFIGRENYTGLRDSTMKTYFKLLSDMGYVAEKHYRYNAQEHTVFFTNGSEQHFRHMSYMPSDPDYNRFGSTEYTDGFVDEAPEVDERACEVLLSRMRYNHAKHGITKELLYTGNPGESWVKYKFVMDENGDYVELPEHRARVLFTILDNPDEQLRESYIKTLELLNDYDRNRLLHGDWNAVREVKRPFAFNFSETKHVSNKAVFQDHLPVRISIDFNYQPFTAVIAHLWADNEGYHLHVFKELTIPNGSIEEMAKQITASAGNLYSIEITGDASGRSGRVKIHDADNNNLFTELKVALGISEKQIRVMSKNPRHKESREHYNQMLEHFPDFKIHPQCINTIRDHRTVEIDDEGKIIKTNRKMDNQKSDHLDCLRYLQNTYLYDWRKRMMVRR
jgi:phage terminase large subunit